MANIQGGQTYKITNVKSGTVIDLSGEDNRSIIGYPYHNGANQKWTLDWTGTSWAIRSSASQVYLALEASPTNGVRLVASPTPGEWHIWRDQTDPNAFRVFVPNTSYNLDLAKYGDPTPGTPVTVWLMWGGPHQTWRFEQA
ncbi:ricin B-like lectin [Infundibulicybe gibba]|nr:ricin B-like lectin [Infundibulicybe gibba]KAF8884590.1 ricin B-like lectin [Infundibulicybe gibba]